MPYPFLGTSARFYSQYLGDDGKTLHAHPGEAYDMTVAAGAGDDLAVPPADGLWGEWQDPPKVTASKTKATPEGRAGKNAAPAAKGE